MKKKSENNCSQLIDKLFPRNLSVGASDNSHPENIDELQKVWEMTQNIASPDPATNAQLHRLTKAMSELPARSKPSAPMLPIWKWPLSRAANYSMSIAAGLVIGMMILWGLQEFDFSTTTVISETEPQLVTLADGSLVELNAGSRLTYSNTSRKVELQGEAFFQVQKDEDQFVVSTGISKLVVLGTAFNVRSRDDRVTVAVEHGRVSFENIRAGGKVFLEANQMSRIVASAAPTAAVEIDLDRYLAWREGRLEFVRTAIVDVFAELERQYAVDFNFEDPEFFRKTLTASFTKSQEINEIVQAICVTLSLTYSKSGKYYEIKTQ